MSFIFLSIPVRIQPVFWVFLLFMTNLYRDISIVNVIVGFVMVFSLLFHEYGHALTSAYFGARPSITLEMFGGYAEYESAGMKRWQQFLITFNGPLFTSLLIAISYFLLKSEVFAGTYFQYVLYITMRLNILWCLLNLIPVIPLDGGRLVQHVLEGKFGAKGYRISLIIGVISAVLAVPVLLIEGYNFFGIFLFILGLQNCQSLRHGVSGTRVESHYSSYLKGLEATNNGDNVKAKQIFKKLIKSDDNYIKQTSIEALAKIYFCENDRQRSYDLLLKADHSSFNEGKCLLCKLAFERENYEIVCKYAYDIYAIEPSYEIALLNSNAFARMNQLGSASAWMSTASQFGIQ